jgi:dTDP-4-amino-4,6-dideoxygalactose transaminase
MSVPFLDLQAQYKSIKNEVDPAIQSVIESSAFASGPAVTAFEEKFATYCHSKHCAGVGSGTAAITLALRACNIGPGDEVITVANTFFATVEAISLVGATVVLVDCNEDDALINVDRIEGAITSNTKAIVPVHLYGQVADMNAIMTIAEAHSLIVIEDAAQAHGAMRAGKRAGSVGDIGCFSFYPGKNLGAYGEAGAVTTNDAETHKRICMLRDHGMARKYHHDVIGYNERMDGIQGAVLGVKLKYLESWNEQRRKHAALYKEKLSGVKLFTTHKDCKHVYHLFVIRSKERDALQKKLQEKRIATGIHYPIPNHLQKAYAGNKWKQGDFPVAEKLAGEVVSLPMYAELTEEQISEVCAAI